MDLSLISEIPPFLIFSVFLVIIITALVVLMLMYSIKMERSRVRRINMIDSKTDVEIVRQVRGAKTNEQVKAVVRDLGQDKPAIRSVNLKKYLELTGWTLEGHGRFTLISKTVGDVKTSILTPDDESLPEYNDMIYNAVLTVASVDGKDFLDLFMYLNAVRLDSINVKSIQDLVL